eukprot:g586.t1
MRDLADRLFGLFESGNFADATALFDRSAVIKQYFGPGNGRPIPLSEFEKSVTALVAVIGAPKYLNRRVFEHKDGFVEQHTSQLKGPKGTVNIEVCVVIKTNASGKIVSLEEYLDPAPLSRPREKNEQSKTRTVRKKQTDVLGPDTCCVIVGATSGIGKEIAYGYAAKGCVIVLAGRRSDLLESVAEKCRSLHHRCRVLAVRTDVTVPDDCARLIARTVTAFGPPARLVLNAGISQNAMVAESGSDLVRRQLATNFFGAIDVLFAALPHMLKAASASSPSLRPRIVVVSSALGLLSAPKNAGYVASKAALNGFFESLRCEIGDRVSISIVAPGPVNTPILRSLSGPRGTKVALDLDAPTLSSMMSAKEAARLTTEACESGTPLLVFPPLDKIVKLKYSGERGAAKVQRLMSSVYGKMKTISVSSKL